MDLELEEAPKNRGHEGTTVAHMERQGNVLTLAF